MLCVFKISCICAVQRAENSADFILPAHKKGFVLATFIQNECHKIQILCVVESMHRRQRKSCAIISYQFPSRPAALVRHTSGTDGSGFRGSCECTCDRSGVCRCWSGRRHDPAVWLECRQINRKRCIPVCTRPPCVFLSSEAADEIAANGVSSVCTSRCLPSSHSLRPAWFFRACVRAREGVSKSSASRCR